MAETSVAKQSKNSSDKLTALAGNEHPNVDAGDRVDYENRLGQYDANLQPVLEWRGPVAFSRVHGTVPGIDHDFGMRWGHSRDQRVSLRLEFGASAGLLYAFDPTWDEYAVIGTGLELAPVQAAFACALKLGEPLAVEDFVALLPPQPAVRCAPGPQL
jgi:hypothetical protein